MDPAFNLNRYYELTIKSKELESSDLNLYDENRCEDEELFLYRKRLLDQFFYNRKNYIISLVKKSLTNEINKSEFFCQFFEIEIETHEILRDFQDHPQHVFNILIDSKSNGFYRVIFDLSITFREAPDDMLPMTEVQFKDILENARLNIEKFLNK